MAANDAPEFVISRTFNAPRDLVWTAWTTRDALKEWWGPKGCAIEIVDLDVRPDGRFHYAMGMPGAGQMWGIFHYLEVEKPSRLVFVNSFSNEQGEIARAFFSDQWPKEVRNVVTLTEEGGKTLMTLRGGPLNATAEERAFFETMFGSLQQGFGGTFDQLDAYLASH